MGHVLCPISLPGRIAMVRALIEQMLGTWGTALLDFYDANGLYINLVVVLYGGLVVFSWMNLKGIRKQLVEELAAQLSRFPNLEGNTPPEYILRRVTIPWVETIGKRRFPLVAQQTSFLPRRATLETVQGLLPAEELAGDALEMLKGARVVRK
jgi:hypothetical protein